ncbi:MAG: cysteine hydrolase [Acholeplasmatales bacterium]|nr:cysteine hydrolase [Acholeplasmatales bacterium]
MKNVLIVIDMQNDFIDGSLGTKEAQSIVPNVIEKIKQYRDAGHHIIFTKDTHEEDYLETFEGKHLPVQHCIHGTDGWHIKEEIFDLFKNCPDKEDIFTCIQKPTFGALAWCSFEFMNWAGIEMKEMKHISGLEYVGGSIEICGLCTDICVISNALILRSMYPQTEILVDSSCCAGVTPEKHEAALEVMRSCQIEVI